MLQGVGVIPSPALPSPRRCQPRSPFLAKSSSEKDSFCLREPGRGFDGAPDLCNLTAMGIFPSRQKALFGTNCGWLLYDHESRDHAPTLGISFVSFLFLFRPQWTIPLGFFYWSFYIFELNIGELEVLALGPLLFAVCWFSGQKLNSSPGSLQMMNSIWIIDLQSFTCT